MQSTYHADTKQVQANTEQISTNQIRSKYEATTKKIPSKYKARTKQTPHTRQILQTPNYTNKSNLGGNVTERGPTLSSSTKKQAELRASPNRPPAAIACMQSSREVE